MTYLGKLGTSAQGSPGSVQATRLAPLDSARLAYYIISFESSSSGVEMRSLDAVSFDVSAQVLCTSVKVQATR
jgi:hypothetical protein